VDVNRRQHDRGAPVREATEKPWRDPAALLVHRTPRRDVPYLPSDAHVLEAMLDLANVGPGDVLYDLGCGDGRIVLAAAKRGAQASGFDIDPQRLRECHDNAARVGMASKVRFVRQSFFDVDLRPANVVTLYLLPGVNVKLRPKLLWELGPGARVVSNNFDMKDWPADQRLAVYHRVLHKWVIPAWVGGDWRCVIDCAPQRGATGRERFTLHLDRRYQFMNGVARVNGHEVSIGDGRSDGERIHFTLWHAEHCRPARHFTGRVSDGTIRGKCVTVGHEAVTWGGIRI
jgi:SAM-dependent methyltransferase